MPTLILPARHNTDFPLLEAAALKQGWKVAPLPYKLPDSGLFAEPVLYGEALFCDMMAAQLGVRLIEPAEDFLVHVPPHWCYRRVWLSTLGEARQALRRPHFVKPAKDKSFPATVYSSGEALPELEEELPVLISEPVRWEVEWRFFVQKGLAVTGSRYFHDGRLDFTPTEREEREANHAIMMLLAEVEELLPPAVVVDIGKIPGKGWAVVEANPVWGSGLYKADPRRVLPVLQAATVPASSDSPWLRPQIGLE